MVGFKDRIASDVTQESVGAVRGVCKACKLMFASIVIIKPARTWRGVQTMPSTSHNTNVSIAEFLQSMSVSKRNDVLGVPSENGTCSSCLEEK